MISLSININKLALIRNSREGNNPKLLEYAKKCIKYGADSITIHPRPDQRHIRTSDCIMLKKKLKIEINIEGNPFENLEKSKNKNVEDYPGFMNIIQKCMPNQCTLVPDIKNQLTSNKTFDLTKDTSQLRECIQEIQKLGTKVSLFVNCNKQQIDLAKEIGVDRIELYTGPYAIGNKNLKLAYKPYKLAALHALNLKLGVNAGHDLNLKNLTLFSKLPGLNEVSIGHSIIVDSIYDGLKKTILRYKTILKT